MSAAPSPPLPILIVDDDEEFTFSAATCLQFAGLSHTVSCSQSERVEDLLLEGGYSCVLLDLSMPSPSGRSLLEVIVRDHPQTPVIVVTASDDVDTAVQCIQAGALDYLTKPVDSARLVTSVRRALRLGDLMTENSSLKQQLVSPGLRHPDAFAPIVTRSKALRGIFRYIEAIGSTDLAILIIGETGVGKELVARAVHEVSGRPGEFVAVNAAGLDDALFSDALFGHVRGAFTGADRDSPGLVRRAAGGTLFLDEIGDLSLDSQVKLLRLLQEREFYPIGDSRAARTDARFLFATGHELATLVSQGLFRPDLYYRLQSHSVVIPPLRERPGDIPILFEHFLRAGASRLNRPVPRVPEEVLGLLREHAFPGNVRELEGLASDALICNPPDALSLEYFRQKLERPAVVLKRMPAAVAGRPTRALGSGELRQEPIPTLKEAERSLMEEAIRLSGGNKTQAARLLGISRQALCNRIRRTRA